MYRSPWVATVSKPSPCFLLDLLMLKGEWGSEYRYHDTGIYGDYIGPVIGIHSLNPEP